MTPERLAEIAAKAYQHMTPWRMAQFSETLARADSLLVARENAFVLGIVQFETAEILALACAPDCQRQGLASAVLEAFKTEAKARGATRILLEVAHDNAPAVAFYAHFGFVQTGKRRGYYARSDRPAADALVMECAI